MTEEKIKNYIKNNYAIYDMNADNLELSILLYKDGYKQGQKDFQCSLIFKNNELHEENEELKKQLESMRATNELKYKDYKNRMSQNATLICNMAAQRDALQEKLKKYTTFLKTAKKLIIKLRAENAALKSK